LQSLSAKYKENLPDSERENKIAIYLAPCDWDEVCLIFLPKKKGINKILA
jgi:hypothetical protein